MFICRTVLRLKPKLGVFDEKKYNTHGIFRKVHRKYLTFRFLEHVCEVTN